MGIRMSRHPCRPFFSGTSVGIRMSRHPARTPREAEQRGDSRVTAAGEEWLAPGAGPPRRGAAAWGFACHGIPLVHCFPAPAWGFACHGIPFDHFFRQQRGDSHVTAPLSSIFSGTRPGIRMSRHPARTPREARQRGDSRVTAAGGEWLAPGAGPTPRAVLKT